jgi:hypothetical protein
MRHLFKSALVTLMPVSVAACGQNSALVSGTDDSPVVSQSEGTIDFGRTVAISGAEINLSDLKPLSPGASSWWVDEEGRAVEFIITLKNTGSRPIEPYLFSVEAQTNDLYCELIFDSEIGLEGVPVDSLAKGQTATWRSGYLCPAATGASLVISVSEDTSTDALVRFTGSMP